MKKEEIDYQKLGYSHGKCLSTGEHAAICPFIFTAGLMVGIKSNGDYEYRFCYPTQETAIEALNQWDGYGDPSGPWIKEKGNRGERHNSLTFKGIPIVEETGLVKNKKMKT